MKKSIVLFFAFFTLIGGIKAQTINQKYGKTDISDAFEFLGVNMFKFDFNEVNDGFNIQIIIDEFNSDSLLFQKKLLYDPSRIKDNQLNEVRIFSWHSNADSETIAMLVEHPSMNSRFKLTVPGEYRTDHFWRQFKIGEIKYDEKIPMLLYGMPWEVKYPNGVSIMKFCPDELKRDLSNEAFNEMSHYYIISYKLIKK